LFAGRLIAPLISFGFGGVTLLENSGDSDYILDIKEDLPPIMSSDGQ
jgi:hypothetical protein